MSHSKDASSSHRKIFKNFVWQNEETTLKMFSNRKHMHNKVDLNYPHSFLRLLNIQWRHFELPYVHCYLFWCLEIQYVRFKHERMFLQSTLSSEISECFSLHFFFSRDFCDKIFVCIHHQFIINRRLKKKLCFTRIPLQKY